MLLEQFVGKEKLDFSWPCTLRLEDHSWGFGDKNPQLKSIQQTTEEIQMSYLKMQSLPYLLLSLSALTVSDRHYKRCKYIAQTVHTVWIFCSEVGSYGKGVLGQAFLCGWDLNQKVLSQSHRHPSNEVVLFCFQIRYTMAGNRGPG